MESDSSLAVRVFACLFAAVLLGGAVTGTVAGATSVGSVAANSPDSLQTTLEETTDSTENTSVSIENATGDATDDLENATENATTVLEDTTNETTDVVEDTTAVTTETVNDTVSNTTDPVDTTVGETAETVDDTVNETATVVNETVSDATAAITETVTDTTTVANQTVTDTTAAVNETVTGPMETVTDTVTGLTGTVGETINASASVEPPSTSEAATSAVLVGMLGAITASGAAASGAGGVGAGGAGASGTAGSATTATAGWLRHLRETDRLRRAVADLWTVLPIFRYSRYDDSDPLEHDCRDAIYETVREQPGAYLSEVSDRTEVPLSTVRYHVRILEDEGLVTARKVNGKRRYFLEDDDAELLAALAEPAKREVLETIAEVGRAHNGRLADALECDPSTISHHLAALEEAELVVAKRTAARRSTNCRRGSKRRWPVSQLPTPTRERFRPTTEFGRDATHGFGSVGHSRSEPAVSKYSSA